MIIAVMGKGSEKMCNFIGGFFTGALFFMFIMALMVASKNGDEYNPCVKGGKQ